MAGIYIHIPFCKKACHYCDFHFSTQNNYVDEMINAIIYEVNIQKDYLSQIPVNTIYFGGGTPSLLSSPQIDKILEAINSNFIIGEQPEVTLEANPDDLDQSHLHDLFNSGINRLSIGIQSFDNHQLKFLNRVHTSEQSKDAIRLAQNAGFNNITIDLMYGLPGSDLQTWQNNLEQAIKLDISHISAYCLTIESNTVFGRWEKNGKLPAIDEDLSITEYHLLVDTLSQHGFEHYEISNFARNQMHSKHNSNYWKFEPYLGVGPSAHSFNKITRQFNVSNNQQYLKNLKEGKIPTTIENLSTTQLANDYLITSLRTIWGCDLNFFESNFNINFWNVKKDEIEVLLAKGWIIIKEKKVFLTEKGKLLADKITEDLYLI